MTALHAQEQTTLRRSQTAAIARLTIRHAIETDLPAIVAIFNATVPTRMVTAQLEPVTIESRLDWFREHSPGHYPLWVAEIDGALAGWLSFEAFRPRRAYHATAEVSVYVHENFRRRGIGRLLLERAIMRGPDLGIRVLVGCIFAHNEPSLRLFEALGFERWGLLPRIAVLDVVERDVAMMGLRLSKTPSTNHQTPEKLQATITKAERLPF